MKYTAIYVRRSVADRDNNSLSIESQIADCIKFLGEGVEHKVYCDNGKSGKDIEHRAEFLRMMEDVKEGLIDRIIVKKYDRFSRNIKDYLNVTSELDKYGVGVQSLTEQFNTTTKEGRLMRNNLLAFAEFERDTIADRCKDAYDTRAQGTGFRMGFAPYGYALERRTVNGKLGTVLVPGDKALVIQKAYELYQNVNTSLKDVMCYFRDNGIETGVPRKARGNSSDRAL